MAPPTWFVFSLLISLCALTFAQDAADCDTVLDLTFVVDSSGSICEDDPSKGKDAAGKDTCNNWKLVQQFMINAVDRLDIGADEVRVAMVVFGNRGTLIWDLNKYTNKDDLKDGILNELTYKYHNTNTSGGFWVALNEVFVSGAGDRSDVANVIIVITDGVSTKDKEFTIPYANKLKEDKDVYMFAVGVTKEIDEDELKAISSPPQELDKTYFLSADFSKLEDILNTVIQVTCEVPEPEKEGNPDCDKLDLAFLIDRSGSICEADPSRGKDSRDQDTCDNWNFIRNFMRNIVSEFSIGPELVRVALATFGNKGELQWNLTAYDDRGELRTALGELGYKYQNTNTSGGLRVIKNEVFSPAGGDRPGVANALIIITDGVSTFDSDRTISDAVALREENDVIIFSIGITELINKLELQQMSSQPQQENVTYFMTADFSSLSGILGSIVNGTCAVATSDCQLDLIFVLDYSGSIGPNKFNHVRQFVADLMNQFDNGTRIGVVLFSGDMRLGFHLNKYTEPKDAAEAMKTIIYKSGRTNTGSAIQYMHEEMFVEGNGDRKDIPNRVIVITDGNSNTPDRKLVITESRAAKAKGIHMLVLGITNWINENELVNIASYPASVNLIKVPDVSKLADVLTKVKDLICNSVNECSGNTCKNGGKCEDGIGIFSCVCPAGFSGETCSRGCRKPSDVAMTLDSSGSIKKVDFLKEVQFARNFVRDGINVDGYSRLAMMEFNDDSIIHWNLDAFTTSSAMLNAFDFYPEGGSTNTAGTLQQMDEDVFGDGDNPEVAIVVTDGRSNNPTNTWERAMVLREQGVTLIAVGVGDNVREYELEGIATNGNVLRVDNFDTLGDSMDDLRDLVCDSVDDCATNPCLNGADCIDFIGGYTCRCASGFTGINCERECSGQIDLVFVFDVSGSMRRKRAQASIQFAADIIKKLEVASDRTRIGAVSFSDQTEMAFGLDQYGVAQDVIQHMTTKIKYRRGRTNTAAAIDMMMDGTFNADGDREGVPNVCIFITSGRSNINPQDTIPNANDATDSGIHMISIGVGDHPNMDEVRALASDPSEDMFLARSYRDMPDLVEKVLAAATCPV